MSTLEMNIQLTETFEDALVYAAQLHKTQIRKGGGVPYISHLMSVSALVLEDGGSEAEAIAALLHDAIEDQGGAATGEEIRKRFGDTVADIVEGCTETAIQPKPPWRERKEAYLAHMATASPEVLRVALADKVHNGRSLLAQHRLHEDAMWAKFKGGAVGTLWFYKAFLQCVQERGCQGFLVEELTQIVTALTQICSA